MAEADIARMSKQKLHSIVKSKVRSAALKYLNTLKKKHTKMDGLKYQKMELQPYLSSPLFNNESRNLLLRLRTRTVNGIRNDFGGLYSDTLCPLGCGEEDTLQNVLTCAVLLSHHKSSDLSVSAVKYEDVFSPDVRKQKAATESFQQLLQIRNEIISQPVAMTA